MPRKFKVTSKPPSKLPPSPSKLPQPPNNWVRKSPPKNSVRKPRYPTMKTVKEGFIANSTSPNDNPNTTKTATRHRGLGSSPGNKKRNNTAKTNKSTGHRVPIPRGVRSAWLLEHQRNNKPTPGNKKRQFKVGAPTESTRVKNLPPFLNWQDRRTGQKYRQYPNNHTVFWLGLENPNPNKTEPNRRKPWFVTNNFVLPNRVRLGHSIV